MEDIKIEGMCILVTNFSVGDNYFFMSIGQVTCAFWLLKVKFTGTKY